MGRGGGWLTPILYLVASEWAHVKISNLEIWSACFNFPPPSIFLSMFSPLNIFFVVGLPPKAGSMEEWPRWGVTTPFLYLLQCYDEFKWGRHWGTFVFITSSLCGGELLSFKKKLRLFTWSFLRWVFSNQTLSIYLIHINKLKPIILCLAGNCFSYLFQFQNLVSVASWMVHRGRNELQHASVRDFFFSLLPTPVD